MAFQLDQIVPWGRLYSEYTAMFALGADDLRGDILGCGDGPASFNATLTAQGGAAVSIDPLYQFTAEEIRRRVEETADVVMAQTAANAHEFVWTTITSLNALREMRLGAMETFLADYEAGRAAGRYINAALPVLPFADNQFDLALCSHFLFLYSAQHDAEFHAQSLRELCRVAREVRVFPLLELGAIRSRHLDTVTERLRGERYRVSIETVPYEFQRGGNEMLRLWHS